MWFWVFVVLAAMAAAYYVGCKSENFVSMKNVKVSPKDTTVDPRDEEEILDTAAHQLATLGTHKLAKSRPDTTSK